MFKVKMSYCGAVSLRFLNYTSKEYLVITAMIIPKSTVSKTGSVLGVKYMPLFSIYNFITL